MIINLTPHAVNIYAPGTPDYLGPKNRTAPALTIAPTFPTARIDEAEVMPGQHFGADAVLKSNGLPAVTDVRFGNVGNLPSPAMNTWYVVSLVCALALPARHDLLVPFDLVRNPAGTVIGCRRLARPV